MFTGIVEKTARIKKIEHAKGALVVSLEKPSSWKLKKGSSIAVNGICSTVVASGVKVFRVAYIPETLSKTTAGFFHRKMSVNLERPLVYGKPLDGHFVLGHVDARATVCAVQRIRHSYLLTVELPTNLRRYAVARGSITIDGVALTIARASGARLTIALVPYTLSHTTLATLRKGDAVNVEVDLLARYLLKDRSGTVRSNARGKKSQKA